MTEENKEGFLASITHYIRDVMYEKGVAKQTDLEMEILRRLGLLQDTGKHATVKRRIYDSLSTFLALDLLVKSEKVLFWKGFPGSEGAPISRSVSLSANLDDESSDCKYSEQFLENATQEEIQAENELLTVQISELEQKIAHIDYFLQRKPAEMELKKVKTPFTVCACRESRASLVLPEEYEGGAIMRAGLIFPKDKIQIVSWENIVECLVERQCDDNQ
ncbi:hypothetical protein SS50377_21817 [Spironucleus salmonicida]|uniref:E2F/DP family winged-helix DNA-binding domain-containing protein n=1 Tax=Spironucleus salmonicida TaxID=348837 RepID=V6LJM5_9EUKA|nr:hypothetical protein SS50377_21817 [Spironucleus salmonicida]|eukprot:EST44795.1 hypothetical protein SS50377_15304 [Spironucleus salmonicida]